MNYLNNFNLYEKYKFIIDTVQKKSQPILEQSKCIVQRVWQDCQEKQKLILQKSILLASHGVEKSADLAISSKKFYAMRKESIINISSSTYEFFHDSLIGQAAVGVLKENAAEYLGWLVASTAVEIARTDILEPTFSAVGATVGYQVGKVASFALPIALAFILKKHASKEIATCKQLTQVVVVYSVAVPILFRLPDVSQAVGESVARYLGPLVVSKIAGSLGGFVAMRYMGSDEKLLDLENLQNSYMLKIAECALVANVLDLTIGSFIEDKIGTNGKMILFDTPIDSLVYNFNALQGLAAHLHNKTLLENVIPKRFSTSGLIEDEAVKRHMIQSVKERGVPLLQTHSNTLSKKTEELLTAQNRDLPIYQSSTYRLLIDTILQKKLSEVGSNTESIQTNLFNEILETEEFSIKKLFKDILKKEFFKFNINFFCEKLQEGLSASEIEKMNEKLSIYLTNDGQHTVKSMENLWDEFGITTLRALADRLIMQSMQQIYVFLENRSIGEAQLSFKNAWENKDPKELEVATQNLNNSIKKSFSENWVHLNAAHIDPYWKHLGFDKEKQTQILWDKLDISLFQNSILSKQLAKTWTDNLQQLEKKWTSAQFTNSSHEEYISALLEIYLPYMLKMMVLNTCLLPRSFTVEEEKAPYILLNHLFFEHYNMVASTSIFHLPQVIFKNLIIGNQDSSEKEKSIISNLKNNFNKLDVIDYLNINNIIRNALRIDINNPTDMILKNI